MENELIVEMKYTREDLEAIYYVNGEGKLLSKPGVKRTILLAIVAVVALVFSSLRAENQPDSPWLIAVVLSILAILYSFFYLVFKTSVFFKWKRSVVKYINALDSTKQTLSCTPESITFSGQKETVVTRWNLVQQVKIYAAYISLYAGADHHILPLASMHKWEYDALCEFIKNKLAGKF